jgi:hypothetical protein
VCVLAHSHDINNECDNEANEQKKLYTIEIPCIRIPFEVDDYLNRLSFKDRWICLNEFIQDLNNLSVTFLDRLLFGVD